MILLPGHIARVHPTATRLCDVCRYESGERTPLPCCRHPAKDHRYLSAPSSQGRLYCRVRVPRDNRGPAEHEYDSKADVPSLTKAQNPIQTVLLIALSI